ncbi:MutS-related protein [Dysosmobacter sp.]|uniref:MutS-related protein n=1 Tax=Dysosmobacter sp. TaxID=2591382 RepID=UPI003AB1779F
MRTSRRKTAARLRRQFGTVPEVNYFPGDMGHIRSYFDFRRDTGRDGFLLDEITWNDLEGDEVFRRINPGLTTSGEQYLYYMLRSPARDEGTWTGRRALIGLMGRDGELRLALQLLLSRLGRARRADLCGAFYPSERGPGWLLVYLAMVIAVIAAACALPFGKGQAAMALILLLSANAGLHEFRLRRIQRDFATVNYTVGMVQTLERIRKLRRPELDRWLGGSYAALDELRSVLRVGALPAMTDNGGAGDLLTTLLLLDLIAYEFLKNKLGRCHEAVFSVHEALGKLDAAIAAASWRESLPRWTEPELDFSGGRAHLEAEGMVHPLLEEAVPNDFSAGGPLLITGSNASGKSTYLKAVAWNAVLAQSLCTCPAERYAASAFRIYTSMALQDDLRAGESYYIVETRSLKRILDAAAEEGAVLCAVDEVLRGTNTVERIAAASAVLETLADRGALCLAATHDGELGPLLAGRYAEGHFTEQLEGDAIFFDYRLRPGPAVTRNAIELLRIMGVEADVVDRARRRAGRYLDTGRWS